MPSFDGMLGQELDLFENVIIILFYFFSDSGTGVIHDNT